MHENEVQLVYREVDKPTAEAEVILKKLVNSADKPASAPDSIMGQLYAFHVQLARQRKEFHGVESPLL